MGPSRKAHRPPDRSNSLPRGTGPLPRIAIRSEATTEAISRETAAPAPVAATAASAKTGEFETIGTDRPIQIKPARRAPSPAWPYSAPATTT